MKGNFTYNLAHIDEYGIDRMRFELGDILVEEPEKTAYLCDEEIKAVIKSSPTWRRTQFRLVDSLVRRFAYEVDEHADPASWAWHQRYEQWKKMRDELKSEAEASDSSPFSLANPSSISQYNKQTAAEAQYGVDAAMSNLQSAQEIGDAQAIAQAQQALVESVKYQKETLKYNRERELKSTGSMIGSTAGAIIGGLAGGPIGVMLGGMLGEMAGNFVGGLVAQHTETSENTPSRS